MLSLLFFLVFVSSTAYSQQLVCDAGWGQCGSTNFCAPLADQCCYDLAIPYACPRTHYCDGGGCCPLGKRCTGGVGVDTSTFESTSTTIYNAGAPTTYTYYSYSSSATTSYTTIISGLGDYTVTSYSTSYSTSTSATTSTSASTSSSTDYNTFTSLSGSGTTTTVSPAPTGTSASFIPPLNSGTTTVSTSATSSAPVPTFTGAAAHDHAPIGKRGAALGLGFGLLALLAV